MEWQQLLYKGGWAGINWPKEYGGAELTATQKYFFNKEMAAVNAPSVIAFGEKMVAPCDYGLWNRCAKRKILTRHSLF